MGKRTLPAFYKPERALKVKNESIHFHPTGTFPQALGKLPLGCLKGSPAEGPALFLQGRAPSGPAERGGAQEELLEPQQGCFINRKPCYSQESFPQLASRVNPRQFTALCPTGGPMAKTRIHIEGSPMEGKVLRTLM